MEVAIDVVANEVLRPRLHAANDLGTTDFSAERISQRKLLLPVPVGPVRMHKFLRLQLSALK